MVRLFFGILRPRKKILGLELVGEIVAVGEAVTKWAVGDEVLADLGFDMGAHAEYVTMSEDAVMAKRPTNLTVEEAAALTFGGGTALYFLKRRADVQPGERVLINGASGAVGSAAVQLAKHWGAHVTAVCSAENLEMVKALGADQVIDYAKQDFTQSGASWDIIMDNVGNVPWQRAKDALSPGGRLLMVVASLPESLRATFISDVNGKRAIKGTASSTVEDIELLVQLAEQGAFKPVIDSVYPLEQIQQAHARVDSGRKHGSVVVRMK